VGELDDTLGDTAGPDDTAGASRGGSSAGRSHAGQSRAGQSGAVRVKSATGKRVAIPENQVVIEAPKRSVFDDFDADFHDIGAHEVTRIEDVDPEFAKLSVADKRSAITKMKQSVATSFGKLAVGLILSAVSLGVLVFALSSWLPYVMAGAAVVAIPSLLYTRARYKKWLKKKSYLVRLCETLGEDMSEYA